MLKDDGCPTAASGAAASNYSMSTMYPGKHGTSGACMVPFVWSLLPFVLSSCVLTLCLLVETVPVGGWMTYHVINANCMLTLRYDCAVSISIDLILGRGGKISISQTRLAKLPSIIVGLVV